MNPHAEGPVAAARRPAVVGPSLAFIAAVITAGAEQLQWEPQAYWLIGAYVALGYLLELIPHKMRHWEVVALSSEATLKQTVSTLRVLVSIVVIAVPVGILATNSAWMSKVPEAFTTQATTLEEQAKKERGRANPQLLRLAGEPPRPARPDPPKADTASDASVIYVGWVEPVPIPGTAPAQAVLQPIDNPAPVAAPPAGMGQLYVMDAKWVVNQWTNKYVLKPIFVMAFFAWLLALVFTFAVFLIENLGEMTRKATERAAT